MNYYTVSQEILIPPDILAKLGYLHLSLSGKL